MGSHKHNIYPPSQIVMMASPVATVGATCVAWNDCDNGECCAYLTTSSSQQQCQLAAFGDCTAGAQCGSWSGCSAGFDCQSGTCIEAEGLPIGLIVGCAIGFFVL